MFFKLKQKMKIFRTVQKRYGIVGISSSNQLPKKYPFVNRILTGFLLFGCSFVSQFMFILDTASGFMEYMECISSLAAGIIIFVCFAAVVVRKTTLFESIANIENLIESSKSF